MRRAILIIVVLLVAATAAPSVAEARCHTHHCWQKVRVNKLERMVEKRIARTAPFRCAGYRSAKPCWVIFQESSMCGFWHALNGPCPGGRPVPDSRTPCIARACGLYQLLGREKGAIWPVVVSWGPRIWRRYRTLKNQLQHHRIARRLPDSAWGG